MSDVDFGNDIRTSVYMRPDGFFGVTQYIDQDGNPIQRTPVEYPYSYDPYVIWGHKDKDAHAVYTDRLQEWDRKKYDKCYTTHFNMSNRGSWEDSNAVTAFLTEYYNKPIILTMIMKCCNLSSGYPIWILFFKDKI